MYKRQVLNEIRTSESKQACDQQQSNVDTEVLFKLLAAEQNLYTECVKGTNSLTHKHAHIAAPSKLDSASGMGISRH